MTVLPAPWTAVLIVVHAVAASYSLLFGAVQLLRRTKGGKAHRIIGRIWVIAMYVVVLTSFGITTISGGFGWLHGLSLLTFCTVSVGVWAAVKRRIHSHKSFMQGSYFGVLGAFIGVIVVPERRIPQMAVHDLPGLLVWIAAISLTVFFTVMGVLRLSKKEKAVLKTP